MLTLILKTIFFILIVLSQFRSINAHDVSQTGNAEDPLTEEFLSLYTDETEHLLDPNDMLAPPRPSIHKMKQKKSFSPPYKDEDHGESDGYENMKSETCHKKLDQCSSQISTLESQLKREMQHITTLKDQMVKEKYVDVSGYYSRILRKFWNILEMEAAERLLGSENEAVIRHLVVEVRQADIAAFKAFFTDQNVHREIDSFFHLSFQRGSWNDGGSALEQLLEKINNFVINIQSFELWMAILWILLFLVGVWAFYLFIQDTRRKLRWGRVIFMMLIIAFLISCIFHWKHMIKVKEVKRQTYLTSPTSNQGRSSCKEIRSVWSKFMGVFFGQQSECEKYYENMTISPVDEISPMMVVSETLSKVVLLPLGDAGVQIAKFFKHFYEGIPWIYIIPANLLFVLLFTITVMGYFGYGLYFPLWLGGIYPCQREDNTDKVKQIIQEGEENLRTTYKQLMSEGREMLTHISQTAIDQFHTSTNETYVDPILSKSVTVIEENLERLIARKLSRFNSRLESGCYDTDYACHGNTDTGCDKDHSRPGNENHGRYDNPSSAEENQLRLWNGGDRSIPRDRSDGGIVRKRSEGLGNERRYFIRSENLQGKENRDRRPTNNNSCCDEFISEVKNVFHDAISLSDDEISQNRAKSIVVRDESFLDTVQNLMTE